MAQTKGPRRPPGRPVERPRRFQVKTTDDLFDAMEAAREPGENRIAFVNEAIRREVARRRS